MGNIERLTSSVVKHALEQHEDSQWDTVVEGMSRETIATIICVAGARTPRQAIRAMQRHLDMLTMAYGVRDLVPA